MILVGSTAIDLVMIIAVSLVVIAVSYLTFILILALRKPKGRRFQQWGSSEDVDLLVDPGFDVVMLMPCLNEEKVLRASLERIQELPHPRLHALIIDDGSDDGTAEVVRSFSKDPRIHLLQRRMPNARQGKGEALNAGFRHLMSGGVIPAGELDPDRTIVVVVDADGRLERHALHTVLPAFEDPELGGVQIGVRINNRTSNLLARMQDIEFVMYTEVFQRGRRHLGSVGLGGNGQFVRLSALGSLTPEPWSDSLCEDLDLGVRLRVQNWELDFCPLTAVHQQGLEDTGRWVKQRTRWFQGHLQSWSLLPDVLDRLRGRARADLLYHLTTPVLKLSSSLFTLAFATWIIQILVGLYLGETEPHWTWAAAYGFAFIPMTVLAFIYRRLEKETHRFGPLRAVVCAHLYVGYAALWYIAGWRAVWNVLRGRNGWAKTDRVDESSVGAEADRLLSGSEESLNAPGSSQRGGSGLGDQDRSFPS